jgi:hypothetical protein
MPTRDKKEKNLNKTKLKEKNAFEIVPTNESNK